MRALALLAFQRQPLLGLLLAFFTPLALGEPAGQVVFVAGGGIAVDSQGGTRSLEKNGPVEEGDTIHTRDGLVQIRFKDGAFVALQPQTEFKVERYRHTAAGDAEDGVIMSLVKGGLRTISGLVGKRDRSAYSMKAAVATIGIRGTDYALQLNSQLVGNVSDGAIEVCNGAGCVGVLAGQAFLVPSLTEMPVLSERQVLLPPAPPRKASRLPDRKVADGRQAEDGVVSARGSKDDASKGTALEHILSPPRAETAVAGPDKSGNVRAVSPSPAPAIALPPGQAKKSGAADVILVLPPPSRANAPPGRLEKLAPVFDALPMTPAKGGVEGSVPLGPVKR